MIRTLVIVTTALTCSLSSISANQSSTNDVYEPNWESLSEHKVVPDWFADAKFGVYFHWGVYSVPAAYGEWYPRIMYIPDADPEEKPWHGCYKYHRETYGEDFHYHDFIPMWKAPKFDAAEWVDVFEDMGAKIIGAIAEHHDGFSMWDSEVNEWNSADMGPRIDVVKVIAEETKKRDLKFMATFHHGFHGMFYPKQENTVVRPASVMSEIYRNCEVPRDEKYSKLYGHYSYEEMHDLWLDKLDEVIDAHCPDYIWMDFGQQFIQEDYRQQFLANYFNKAQSLDKEVVVNTKGTFFPRNIAINNVEQRTMAGIQDEVWVTDFTMGYYWSFIKDSRHAMTQAHAIRFLADVVSKNGVMLFSIGPMADGTLPKEQVESMQAIGRWMKLYGEAIYETRPFDVYGEGPSEFQSWEPNGPVLKKDMYVLNPEDVRYTRSKDGKTIYAIQLGWREDGSTRELKNIGSDTGYQVASVEVLGSSAQIKWDQATDALTVTQPEEKPAEADAALVFKIKVK